MVTVNYNNDDKSSHLVWTQQFEKKMAHTTQMQTFSGGDF